MVKKYLREKYFLNFQLQKNFLAIQDRGIAPFSHSGLSSWVVLLLTSKLVLDPQALDIIIAYQFNQDKPLLSRSLKIQINCF